VATQAYWDWVARGRAYRLATPISELKAKGRAAGVGWLGDLGNESHLQASTPEDHTPFSATEWPVSLSGYVVCAIDWVDGAHSDRLLADARAGRAPWLKYLNFRGRNYSVRRGWQSQPNPDHHLHISIRSDWADRSIGSYNPFVAGGAVAPVEEETRMFMIQVAGEPTVYVSDGFQHRGIDWDTFLMYRDNLSLRFVTVPDARALRARAGTYREVPGVAAPEFTEEQLSQVALTAEWGAGDSSSGMIGARFPADIDSGN
jgi:hypothetical protein